MTDRPYSHLAVDRLLPQYWRVPSIIGRSTRSLLRRSQSCPRLVESIEDDDNLTVVVFTSRNPEFFLAHYDTERDPAKTVTMPPGPTGMQPCLTRRPD